MYYCEISLTSGTPAYTSAGSHGCLTLTKKPELMSVSTLMGFSSLLNIAMQSWDKQLSQFCMFTDVWSEVIISATGMTAGPYRVHNIVHFLSWVAGRLLCQLHQGKDRVFLHLNFFLDCGVGQRSTCGW